MAARPYARMGAQDSQAVFDAAVHDRRKNVTRNGGCAPYYPSAGNIADECIQEHDILLTSKQSGHSGDKNARVFASLNGMGSECGVKDRMSDEAALLAMRANHSYAGVAVTDFIRQKSSGHGPDEGFNLTITHGGINTIYSPLEALRPGQLIKADFPTNAEQRSMKRRRGAPGTKVTMVPRAWKPYSVGKTAQTALKTILDSGPELQASSPETYSKWNTFAHALADSYLMAGAEVAAAYLSETGAATTKTAEQIATELGCMRQRATAGGKTKRAAVLRKIAGLARADATSSSEYAVAAANHMRRAVGAFADATEDDRRYIIGKCVQGCRKEGFATVALGITQ